MRQYEEQLANPNPIIYRSSPQRMNSNTNSQSQFAKRVTNDQKEEESKRLTTQVIDLSQHLIVDTSMPKIQQHQQSSQDNLLKDEMTIFNATKSFSNTSFNRQQPNDISRALSRLNEQSNNQNSKIINVNQTISRNQSQSPLKERIGSQKNL